MKISGFGSITDFGSDTSNGMAIQFPASNVPRIIETIRASIKPVDFTKYTTANLFFAGLFVFQNLVSDADANFASASGGLTLSIPNQQSVPKILFQDTVKESLYGSGSFEAKPNILIPANAEVTVYLTQTSRLSSASGSSFAETCFRVLSAFGKTIDFSDSNVNPNPFGKSR